MKKGSLLPVLILTVAAFVFNTSESAPIGLLTDISADLGISEARAGFLISAYAWVVAIMSLPLMMACSHVEYRKLMIGIVGLFVASHVVSGIATGYYMLMFSRMGVACAHSLFWAVATPIAVEVSPKGRRAPFVCIEPWKGRADAEGFMGDIAQREWIQHLAAGGQQVFRYEIGLM